MAIANFTVAANNTSDATFRAWGLALSNAMTAVGVIKTADTGQIDWATVVKPLANAMSGYEIRVLSTPSPVYIKFQFGATSTQTSPCIIVSVGTGTDGAGNLTGNQSTPSTTQFSTIFNVIPYACYVSGDTSRLSMMLWHQDTAGNFGMCMSIGRRKDDAGADLDLGVQIIIATAGAKYQQFLPKDGGGSPYPVVPMTSLQTLCPVAGGAAYASNVGFFPVFINLGAPENPDMGMGAFISGEFASGAVITVTMYGQNYNFICGGLAMGANANGNTSSRIAVRYD